MPEGYAVVVFSHTGLGSYEKDETVEPPVYTATSLSEQFAILMDFCKAMNDGYAGTLTGTINGTQYTWNVDFTAKQREFVGAIIGIVAGLIA